MPLVRDVLDDVVFVAEWEIGFAMSRDMAVALALEEESLSKKASETSATLFASDPPVPLAELTPREREVAVLMANGRTNEQIAAELFITIKTVE